MRQSLLTFILLLSLPFSGCDENEYTIHMRYDGDGVIRKVVCSGNMPPGIHAKLQELYPRQIDANSYEGTFKENLPDDVGGFGRNLHLSNPMGDAYIYIERFRGDDAQALDIEKAFDATDHLVDLVIDWLELELGSNANFGKLKTFCNEELRADIKNLIIYMWIGNRIDYYQEKDLAMRMSLYLYEREYFTITDISNIAASTDRKAWILSYVRRLIAKKLGYSSAEEAAKELAFLQDQNTVQQSASRFLASPKIYKRVLQAARARSGDPNLVIGPKLFDDFNDIAEEILEGYGIELETFFIGFDIFGSSPDKVNVKLDCPRKPCETNGEWDEDTKHMSWSSRVTADKLPFMCHATIGEPNDEFQKRHFGRVILEDEQLVTYAFWYKGLNNDQKREWDEFLVSLDPNQELESKVESFRFQNAPPPSPDSSGEVRLLSDLPRNLIVDGLKMKKDQQESDSQKSAKAETGSDKEAAIYQPMEIFPLIEQHCHGSTIVELPNGDLLAAWFQGSGERWADDVAIMGARLVKGADKWTKPFVMADVLGFPDINPILFLDPQDRLWLMWYTVIANQWETSLLKYRISSDYASPDGPPNWTWQDVLHIKPGDPAERGIQPNDRFVKSVERQADEYIKSMPQADSMAGRVADKVKAELWKAHLLSKARGEDMLSKGILIDPNVSQTNAQLGYPYFRRMGWQTKNKAVMVGDGRIIVPLYSDGFSFSLMAITDDLGRTWQFSEPLVGGGNIQPSIAVKADGTLVAYMRDNGPPPQRLHVSSSTDKGLTWSNVRDSELPNPGSGADIVTLRNGHWLLAYNDTENGRHSLAVSISTNEGKTWPFTRRLENDTRDKSIATRSHYPSVIQGRDGSLHIVYSYHHNDRKNGPGKTIKYVHFNEAWVGFHLKAEGEIR